jgi:hypothetical protein
LARIEWVIGVQNAPLIPYQHLGLVQGEEVLNHVVPTGSGETALGECHFEDERILELP